MLQHFKNHRSIFSTLKLTQSYCFLNLPNTLVLATVTYTTDKTVKAENIIRSQNDYHTQVFMPASLMLKLTTTSHHHSWRFMIYHAIETVSSTVEAFVKFCLSSKVFHCWHTTKAEKISSCVYKKCIELSWNQEVGATILLTLHTWGILASNRRQPD